MILFNIHYGSRLIIVHNRQILERERERVGELRSYEKKAEKFKREASRCIPT